MPRRGTRPSSPPPPPPSASTPLLGGGSRAQHAHTTYSGDFALRDRSDSEESEASDSGMAQQQRSPAAPSRRSSSSTSDEDEDHPAPPSQSRGTLAERERKQQQKSNTDLASPLIDNEQQYPQSSEGSGDQGSKRKGRRPQRELHLKNGEFKLGDREVDYALSRRSWFAKYFGKPRVTRDDVFPSNFVRSSRYTLLTFLPVNLFEQLSPHNKAANFYFLVIAALQCVREISTTGGRPSILLPLMFVLVVTAVKDAVEDYARHKQDRSKNQAEYEVLTSGEGGQAQGQAQGHVAWTDKKSKDLRVGDLVRVWEGQRIPADMLLVSSGAPSGAFVFVDTKELDGETALKVKGVPQPFLHGGFKRDRGEGKHSKLGRMELTLRTEPPSGQMNSWAGDMRVHDLEGKGEGKRDNVTVANMLWTDSVLRNTPWCVGLCVYTGEEQRIRQNMAEQIRLNRQKESDVFTLIKTFFRWMVIIQFVLCMVAAIASGIYQHENWMNETFYLKPTQSPFTFAALRFGTFFIILKDWIPISLYVSLELVQFWQAMFIAWDRKMIRRIGGEDVPASAQTSKLNEQLSQVKFIFSDKTGTLTQNSMVFRKAIIAGEMYGTGTTQAGKLRKRKMQQAERRKAQAHDHSRTAIEMDDSSSSEDEGDHEEQQQQRDQASSSPSERPGNKGDKGDKDSQRLCVPHADFNETQRIVDALSDLPTLSERLAQEKGSSSSSSSSSSKSGKSSSSSSSSSSKKKSKGSGKDKGNDGSSSSSSSSSSKDAPADMVQLFLYALALNNSVFPKPRARDDDDSSDDDDEGAGDEAAAKRKSSAAAATADKQRRKSSARGSPSPAKSNPDRKGSAARGRSSGLSSPTSPDGEDAPGHLDPLGDDEDVVLESSSPDELALVSFAQGLGFELVRRAGGMVDLRSRKMNLEQIQAHSHKLHEQDEEVQQQKRKKNQEQEQQQQEAKSSLEEEERRRQRRASSAVSSSPPALARGGGGDGGGARSSPAAADLPQPVTESFSELLMLDFTSKRKRMTVVLRPQGQDRVLVLIKGADSALRPFLEQATPPEEWEATLSAMGELGGESLRTLMVGYSIQPLSWFEKLKPDYDAAQRHQGPEEKGHVEGNCSEACKLCEAENKVEEAAELKLLGATAIEDQLQDRVPRTLSHLLKAGIGVWVLTGDTLSTATNIAIACNLLDADMSNDGRLFTIDRQDAETPEQLREVIEDCMGKIDEAEAGAAQGEGRGSTGTAPAQEFGLCFHGDVFKVCQKDERRRLKSKECDDDDDDDDRDTPALQELFFDLAARCRSVVACRLEPKEKADIVKLMKARTGKCVLAIGDGNNDTPMIKQADIGVGVRGLEGTSAVASSDFAISEFKFLERLLTVHGRLNYRRVSLLALYIFYKSSLLVWTLFLFGLYSQFSGTYMYLDWAVQLHNVFFTALPILVFAVLDRDMSFETLEKNPEIYSLTRGQTMFSVGIFVRWWSLSVAQALVCFFVPLYAFEDVSSPDSNGQGFGLWSTGLTVYTCVVLTTNLKLVTEIAFWSWLQHLTLWGSTFLFFVCMSIFSSSTIFAIGGGDYYFVFFRLAALPRYWLVVIITVGLCVGMDMFVQGMQRIALEPTPTLVMQSVERGRATRNKPQLKRAVAKALAMEVLQREQEELAQHRKQRGGGKRGQAAGGSASSSAHLASSPSWNDSGADATPDRRRPAALSLDTRRKMHKKAASHANLTSYQTMDDERKADAIEIMMRSKALTPPPPRRQPTYTGFAFTVTPRSAYDISTLQPFK